MTDTRKIMKKQVIVPYRDASLPIRKRVEDLLGRMTIEEKVAQLMGLWNGGVEDFKPEIFDDPARMKEIFGKGCNSVHPAPFGIRETVKIRNKIQKYLVEETRLGIPALFVDEGQHGMMRPESTVFPRLSAWPALGTLSSLKKSMASSPTRCAHEAHIML
jgi:beta-glucosidase